MMQLFAMEPYYAEASKGRQGNSVVNSNNNNAQEISQDNKWTIHYLSAMTNDEFFNFKNNLFEKCDDIDKLSAVVSKYANCSERMADFHNFINSYKIELQLNEQLDQKHENLFFNEIQKYRSSRFHIAILPDEILIQIFKQILNSKDLASTAMALRSLPLVCKRFNQLVNDKNLIDMTWNEIYDFMFDFSGKYAKFEIDIDKFALQTITVKPADIFKKIKEFRKALQDKLALITTFNVNSPNIFEIAHNNVSEFVNIISLLLKSKTFEKCQSEDSAKLGCLIIDTWHKTIFFLTNPSSAQEHLMEKDLDLISKYQTEFVEKIVPMIMDFPEIKDHLYKQALEYNNNAVLQAMRNNGHEAKFTQEDLFEAVKKGNLNLAKQILKDQKIDINAKDAKGYSAIFFAIFMRDLEMTKMLIDAGANANVINNINSVHKTVLGASINQNIQNNPCELELINLLLSRVSLEIVNAATNSMGHTALMKAAMWNGKLEILKRLLLIPGIDINAKAANGETALSLTFFMKKQDNPEIALLLIKAGADWKPYEKDLRELNNKEINELLFPKKEEKQEVQDFDCPVCTDKKFVGNEKEFGQCTNCKNHTCWECIDTITAGDIYSAKFKCPICRHTGEPVQSKPTSGNSNNNNNSTIKPKDEVENECPICRVADLTSESTGLLGCCNQKVCMKCVKQMIKGNGFNCPFCRTYIGFPNK